MTKVDLLLLWGTSVVIDLGDIDEDEALYNSDEFDWKQFDDALTGYLDSLSEEELRDLYRGPEAITVEDPVFGESGEADIVLGPNNDLPDYLQSIVNEAQRYYDNSDVTVSEAAYDVASEQRHIVSNRGERDNLEVLQDLREAGYLCTDELDNYSRAASTYDHDEATLEAIVQRSLEELLHERLN